MQPPIRNAYLLSIHSTDSKKQGAFSRLKLTHYFHHILHSTFNYTVLAKKLKILTTTQAGTVRPAHYRTRHFFNNSNTNEYIATKFQQQYVRCMRNEEECVCSPLKHSLQYPH